MGFKSFVKSIVDEIFHEDLGTIFNLPMFVDPQAVYVMLLLCYAQHFGYLFCIVFSSLDIL
jgi:hypothetical protein